MFYRCFLPVCTFKSAAIFTLSPMGLSNISKKDGAPAHAICFMATGRCQPRKITAVYQKQWKVAGNRQSVKSSEFFPKFPSRPVCYLSQPFNYSHYTFIKPG